MYIRLCLNYLKQLAVIEFASSVTLQVIENMKRTIDVHKIIEVKERQSGRGEPSLY